MFIGALWVALGLGGALFMLVKLDFSGKINPRQLQHIGAIV